MLCIIQMKSVVWYLLASVALSAVIYGSALWGGRMLAPLDIGPDLFTQYKYMDPAADGVPENHHIIDQFTYDLPLQYAIYRAYHTGEIPWWDPYTYAGRPLLADAHVNGTDPVRLMCYAALPFELAYNWNYILRGILTGLGMFLLLRSLGVSPVIAGILAITYQYAGWFTLYWGHPWIQGSFLYFPYLWMVWMRAMQQAPWFNLGLGGLLCGMVFYAGNLQSHAYLPLFAVSFLAATLVKSPKQFYRALGVTALSGLIGVLLAAPVLCNQIEFFFNSVRSIEVLGSCAWYYRMLALPFSFGSYYPWMFGTFRTLDVGHVTQMTGMAFQWFCGIGCSCLAMWGVWVLRREQGKCGVAICQACLLIVIYLGVVSTPLATYLYARCSPLAGMGLIVLAALAAQAVIDRRVLPQRWLMKSIVGVVVATSISTSALAWWVYPVFKARIELMSLEADKNNATLMSAPNLRRSQVDCFPKEVSLMNPEAATTLVALVLLVFAMTRYGNCDLSRRSLVLALLVSSLPVLIFHYRFRPSQPIMLWHQLVAGGPAQTEAMTLLEGGLRLDESAMNPGAAVFPNATAAMYRVHVLHGYSALQPNCLVRYPPTASAIPGDWRADYSDYPAIQTGNAKLVPGFNPKGGYARFRLLSTGGPAAVKIGNESQNRLVMDASALPEGESLVRTDTYYPGWVVRNGEDEVGIAKEGACFSVIAQAHGKSAGLIRLEYRPAYLSIALPCLVIGMLFVAASLLAGVSLPFCRRS